jgi:hypothetical protein
MVKFILIFVFTCQICAAQDLDGLLAKSIKTEINLNRIMASKSPLTLTTYMKSRADSLCVAYFQRYNGSRHETSKEVRKDFQGMHKFLEEQMDKDSTVAYNFFVVHPEEDYGIVLKGMMRDPAAYFYKLYHTQCSIAAIRHNNEIFVTVISW